MESSEDKWAEFHKNALPYERAVRCEPFKTLLYTIGPFVSAHKIDALFESGFGTGYLMVRLSEYFCPSLPILGTDNSPGCVKRFEELAKKQGVLFGDHGMIGAGTITNVSTDIFDPQLYEKHSQAFAGGERPLIYHQGLLEHFSDDKIKELLELQLAHSYAVIFSIPSAFYGRQDFGDERLMSREEWQELLLPFDVIQLDYYDKKRHILGILKGGLYAGK